MTFVSVLVLISFVTSSTTMAAAPASTETFGLLGGLKKTFHKARRSSTPEVFKPYEKSQLIADIQAFKQAQEQQSSFPSLRQFANGLLTAGLLTAPSAFKARLSITTWNALVNARYRVLFNGLEDLQKLNSTVLDPILLMQQSRPILLQMAERLSLEGQKLHTTSFEEFYEARRLIETEAQLMTQWLNRYILIKPGAKTFFNRVVILGSVLLVAGFAIRVYFSLTRKFSKTANELSPQMIADYLQLDEDEMLSQAESHPQLAEFTHQVACLLRTHRLCTDHLLVDPDSLGDEPGP